MRNIPKFFFSGPNTNKLVLAKLNPDGFNSPVRLNFFFRPFRPNVSRFDYIHVPVFDTKSSYSSFTYKYFCSKFKKFEQKISYLNYFKFPQLFPKFTRSFSLFSNLFLLKRRLRRRRGNKLRIFVKIKNQPFQGSRSMLKFYKILAQKKKRFFIRKYDYFLIKKRSLKNLAFRKKLKSIFRKLWQRRGRKKFRKPPTTRFYFERRTISYRVFKLFRYRKFKKKTKLARRYAYRKISFGRRSAKAFFPNFVFFPSSKKSNIANKRFLRKIAKKAFRFGFSKKYKRSKTNFRSFIRMSEKLFGRKKLFTFKSYLFSKFFCPYFKKFNNKFKAFSGFNKNFFFNSDQNKFYYSEAPKIFKNFALNVQFFKTFSTTHKFEKHRSKFFHFLPFFFALKYTNKRSYNKFRALQFFQKRRIIQNLRIFTYFSLFIRSLQFSRHYKFYHKIQTKFLRIFYANCHNGQFFHFLPFFFNNFFYFGFFSHFNSNIYFYDPTKFSQFFVFKNKKKVFSLKNNFLLCHNLIFLASPTNLLGVFFILLFFIFWLIIL
jgi:hypothetical protein